MTFIDACLIPVPTDVKETYVAHSIEAAKVFKEHGAIALCDAWGEDVPEGKLNSMHTAVLREPNETVVLSWIIWPDRATRDAGMAKVMADPRMEQNPMPFDGKRMIFGGFEQVVDA